MSGTVFSSAYYHFNVNAIPPLVAAVATLFVGLFVIVREKASRVSILFLVYALTAYLWLFSYAMSRFSQAEQVVFWWAKALHVGVTLLPAALYHFTVVVLQRYQKRKSSVWFVWAVGVLFLGVILTTNALFDGLYYYSWGSYVKYKWFGVPFLLYHFVTMVAILHFYFAEYRGSIQGTLHHRRAGALFLAFCIGYIAALDFLPTIGIPYYPLGAFPMLALLILVTRVIWRYRLVDITPAFAAHQIIETMSDALLVLDKEGIIRLTNRAAAGLFGQTEREMTGKQVSTIIADPLFVTLIEQVSSSGRISNFEIANPGRNGAVILSLSASILCDQTGEAAGMVCVARDITDRKRMEEDRLRSQKLESLGTLAGGIAHDFNNLLTGILGNLSLARAFVEQNSTLDRRLLEAEKASLWAKDLTQQLLTFSLGGAPVKKTIAIAALIRDSTELALRGARNRAEFHIPRDVWPVDVDEGQLRQVIQNLVINADQAMPHGGTIEVRCENTIIGEEGNLPAATGNYVKISIRDQGIGIPKEHLQKIFDPYFTTKQKGSGLGLASAYSIVKNHGGFIKVESQLAEGTIFHAYLPASQKEPTGEKQQGTEFFIGAGRILIMDDEDILRAVATEMLRHLGYTVEAANDGHEALVKYKAARESGDPFDLVILDLTVPGGMGGRETIERLREIDPYVKAIVSSGYSQDPVMSDFEKHGFAGVVPKPYKIQELSESVHKALKTQFT